MYSKNKVEVEKKSNIIPTPLWEFAYNNEVTFWFVFFLPEYIADYFSKKNTGTIKILIEYTFYSSSYSLKFYTVQYQV